MHYPAIFAVKEVREYANLIWLSDLERFLVFLP
jgi:hypothetical protein